MGSFDRLHAGSQAPQPSTTKNIVILGASYGGISTAHRILKQAGRTGPLKITLVSPNTHFYWNMASPRGVIPGQLTDDQLFQPIAPGFRKYPTTQFEFILASAQSLDVEAKTIGIIGSEGAKTLKYDFLILATGSRTKVETPFKGLETTEATRIALHDFQKRVKSAQTITVAGGGVTSVEVAGELASEYGQQKKIILIASGTTILHESPSSVSSYATNELQNLKVDIRRKAKVVSSVQLPDGQLELKLAGGESLLTDMYIPAYGLSPNSSYIPSKFLNAGGSVLVDDHLKVEGAEDVWAIGDVASIEPSQFINCNKQSIYVAKSFASIMRNESPSSYKVATSRFMGFQIGRKAGTGFYGRLKIPSFIIRTARRNLFIENMGPTVDGTLF